MFEKLVHLLNVLQSKEGYTVEQIREYMQTRMTLEERMTLLVGYRQHKTADMGDSVLIAVSMIRPLVVDWIINNEEPCDCGCHLPGLTSIPDCCNCGHSGETGKF